MVEKNKKYENISKYNICCVLTACAIMLFSMYAPYIRTFSYLYQIIVAVIIAYVGRKTISTVPILLLLTTTRDYIAASTSETFSAYYGINGIVLSAIILLLAIMNLYKNHWKIPNVKMFLILDMFGVMMLLSRLYTSNTLEYGQFFIAICLIYITFPYIVNSEEDIFIIRISFALAGLFLALGILPYILQYESLTIYSTFIDENNLLVDRNYQSLFVILCVLQTLAFLLDYGKKIPFLLKVFSVFIMIADLVIVILGGSRSAVITIGLAVLIYLLMNRKNPKYFLSFLVLGLLVVISAYQIGLFDAIFERFKFSDVASGNGRLIIWSRYLDNFLNGNLFQIIFGQGLVGQTVNGIVAHNVFISILFCFGILGFALFIICIVDIVFKCIKIKMWNELMIFIPILIMCCTLEPYYRIEFAIYFALLSGSAEYYMRRIKYNEF